MAYTFHCESSRIDAQAAHGLLSGTYWAQGRTLETVRRSIENSLCFAVEHEADGLVGLARVVTDKATFAWLCDVVIAPGHRGAGLGKQLMERVMAHPELQGLRRFLLATRDAHGLYERHGFRPLERPERWMEIRRPD